MLRTLRLRNLRNNHRLPNLRNALFGAGRILVLLVGPIPVMYLT